MNVTPSMKIYKTLIYFRNQQCVCDLVVSKYKKGKNPKETSRCKRNTPSSNLNVRKKGNFACKSSTKTPFPLICIKPI